MKDKLLNIKEAAKYLNVHRLTVYRWVTKKKMPAFKVGRIWRFRKEKIDAWLEKKEITKK
jgi:excisionase family DNA binding protein